MRGILIVDDDASIRFAMADYFSAKGYRAESVASREELEVRLAEGTCGIVITDLRLGPEDEAEGLEIVRMVTQQYRDIACIVLTAYGSPDSESAALRYGAKAFLHKPRPLAEVLALLKTLLPREDTCPMETTAAPQAARPASDRATSPQP